jgi:uncharacterized protein
MTFEIGVILLGAMAGGFVNGLTGLGTGMTAMPIWLLALSPVLAAQLAAAASVAGQLTTLRSIWPLIRIRAVAPYVIAGLLGMPIGVWLLPHLDPTTFKLGVGGMIVAYCLIMQFAAHRLRVNRSSTATEALIGFVGGIGGGIAGLAGPPLIVWASSRGMSKDDKRALFQAFNLTILAAMLVASAAAGLIGWPFLRTVLISLPATLLSARLGHWVYARLNERRFDALVLALLAISGLMLIAANVEWPFDASKWEFKPLRP